MKDKIYRRLDRLAGGARDGRVLMERLLLGYVISRRRKKPDQWDGLVDSLRESKPRRPSLGVPIAIRELEATINEIKTAWMKQRNYSGEYLVAMPKTRDMMLAAHSFNDKVHWYEGSYDRTFIRVTPNWQNHKTIQIIVPPTWHRMIREVGVAIVMSRRTPVKLIQHVSNRRTFDGGFTAWDCAYFDLRSGPSWVDGVLVRKGEIYALEPTFTKAFSECRRLVVKDTLRELKESLDDDEPADD